MNDQDRPDERVIFNGVQRVDGNNSAVYVAPYVFGVFTDRLTGATFCVEIGGDVLAALAAKRKQFEKKGAAE